VNTTEISNVEDAELVARRIAITEDLRRQITVQVDILWAEDDAIVELYRRRLRSAEGPAESPARSDLNVAGP
jgi:hypothetical protein